jgi:hypothetical protein
MYQSAEAQRLTQSRGLRLVPITWEDTGRYKNSAVGPNISDLSIQVDELDTKGKPRSARLMPVIRYDNFTDRTADVDPMQFTLLVGNHRGQDLKQISLREFLEDPTRFLSEPDSWRGPVKSLLAPRDTRVLVSAQAVFLPIDQKQGRAEFNPVLFNYQSSRGNPAVLTVLATQKGTSIQVIENTPDFSSAMGWGQRLFHNHNGQRAALIGTRKSDEIKRRRDRGEVVAGTEADSRATDGLNTVLLIQVPLKYREAPRRAEFGGLGGAGADLESASMQKGAVPRSGRSNVESAVIGFGPSLGPMPEVNGMVIERDPRFPIRVTVQFYKATSNGVMSADDIDQIKAEIDGVLNSGDAVGSLVVDGDTGRATEFEGLKVQPESWWSEFWQRHQRNTGETRELATARLTKLMGTDFRRRAVSELMLSRQLRPSKAEQ